MRMMAAVQPFLSGAISKTVNMPNSCTPDDIYDIYMEAWRMGLKSIAVYRDGSKRTQPLNVSGSKDKQTEQSEQSEPVQGLIRRRMPLERNAITHKFSIGGHEGYMTVGLFEDNTPGELFITMSKEGSTISGIMDGFATAVSLCLQHGVAVDILVDKFSHTRYEPSGFTGNPNIPIAKSITDYIFRWLGIKFAPSSYKEISNNSKQNESNLKEILTSSFDNYSSLQEDAPPCMECGSIMVRSGTCYKCMNCGSSSGCS